jgi:hypothetical protein
MGFNDKFALLDFPKLDYPFCSSTVPVIAIPLAFRRRPVW